MTQLLETGNKSTPLPNNTMNLTWQEVLKLSKPVVLHRIRSCEHVNEHINYLVLCSMVYHNQSKYMNNLLDFNQAKLAKLLRKEASAVEVLEDDTSFAAMVNAIGASISYIEELGKQLRYS